MLYHIKHAAIINWRENYIQFQCVLQLAALGSQHFKEHTRMSGEGVLNKEPTPHPFHHIPFMTDSDLFHVPFIDKLYPFHMPVYNDTFLLTSVNAPSFQYQ